MWLLKNISIFLVKDTKAEKIATIPLKAVAYFKNDFALFFVHINPMNNIHMARMSCVFAQIF